MCLDMRFLPSSSSLSPALFPLSVFFLISNSLLLSLSLSSCLCHCLCLSVCVCVSLHGGRLNGPRSWTIGLEDGPSRPNNDAVLKLLKNVSNCGMVDTMGTKDDVSQCRENGSNGMMNLHKSPWNRHAVVTQLFGVVSRFHRLYPEFRRVIRLHESVGPASFAYRYG